MEDFLWLSARPEKQKPLWRFYDMKYQSPHLLPFTPKALCLSERTVFELHTSPNIMQADSSQYKYALTLMQDMM